MELKRHALGIRFSLSELGLTMTAHTRRRHNPELTPGRSRNQMI